MSDWTQKQIDAVWAKLPSISGQKAEWKKDKAGAWINYNQHGEVKSQYGWEIDHIYPESKGGSDDLSNLQALQWENNRSKDDNYPNYTTVVTSNGVDNIKQNKHWRE